MIYFDTCNWVDTRWQ